MASAPSAGTLAALRQNAQRSAPLVVYERLRLAQFAWHRLRQGSAAAAAPGAGEGATADEEEQQEEEARRQQAALCGAVPRGFDLVVAADPLTEGSCGECERLAGMLASLLRRAPHCVALLCQSGGAAMCDQREQSDGLLAGVAAAAAAYGLAPAALPEAGAAGLVQAAASEGVETLCLMWREEERGLGID